MKKEIMALINSEEGTLNINNICCLRRWTKNALGMDVDWLMLEFKALNEVSFGMAETEIKSRDYMDIIAEIEALINAYMEQVRAKLVSDLKAGYRNVR